MSSLGLNRGSDPTGQADAYAGRSSLGELLRSLPPPPTTLSGMRGEYLQLVQDLATDMQATRNHLTTLQSEIYGLAALSGQLLDVRSGGGLQ